MRTEQPGFADANAEILKNQAQCGERAGINKADIQQLETLNSRIALLDEKRPSLLKLVEVVDETRAQLVDERERLICAVIFLQREN